ncbi:hypothetical protein [Cardinium endosymbiont of Nabis limbatus]|uniref:hypothetical protein n=1 Tax=Cardinium endosymbiont of Nabis limbatus TaxID=3066217 RepID=UPI003AF3535E
MDKKTPYVYQIRVARLTTIVIGLCAMCVAFSCRDLLKLMFLAIDFSIPVVTAPFILSVFGFRGTSRTALIGMATGTLAILVWSKWVEPLDPEIGIDGAFPCMLANGLAMMAAHYLLKQPKSTGWVKPDSIFTQIQQENARKRAERRETIKNAWVNRKVILANLVPSHTTIVYIGCYTTVTSLLAYFIMHITHHGSWLILQLFVSTCWLGYPFIYDISKKIRSIPAWYIGLCWLIGLTLYLPLNLLWHSWNSGNSIFTTSLFLAHCAVILWVLPLYLGIAGLTVTLLVVIYPISTGLPYPVLCSLCPIFIVILLLFTIIICLKSKLDNSMKQVIYLKDQEGIRESQQLKASLYDAALIPCTGAAPSKGYGFILNQIVRKVEESISFLDNHTPLFKEDIQSIINKFYDWIIYFNRREKAKDHALLQPDKITLEKLIRKVEVSLSQEVATPPRLLVETINLPNREPCPDIVCDIHQVVYSLVKSILRIGKLEGPNVPIIRIQLYATSLQFKRADPIDSSHAAFIDFQATALVISQATIDSDTLPKVKEVYNDTIDTTDAQDKKKVLPSIDLEQDTISTIVSAHYGYLEVSIDSKPPTMLLVFPSDVTDILDNMTVELPLDCLTSEGLITPKEQASSMMALMKFHDYICKASHEEDPIDVKIISGLLLLLRQHFRFKRHASGQLFYVRAVGITELVVEWVFHSPKVIYASLLYELVRYTCLPISYIKEHYNLGVYSFVLNIVGIDKRQDLDHSSLLYVQNRLKEAIREDHVQLSVLFIKLAERLYDLRHAAGYIHLQEVVHMVKETLAIDVRLANEYLGPEIGPLLEKAAKQALKVCKGKENSTRKDQGS